MLPREHRYPFFQGVPEKSYSTPFFTLRYRGNENNAVRVAIVVGKKVHKLSHERNRVKRVFGEIVSEVICDWDAAFDLVFYLKKHTIAASPEEIRRELIKTFRKIGVVQ